MPAALPPTPLLLSNPLLLQHHLHRHQLCGRGKPHVQRAAAHRDAGRVSWGQSASCRLRPSSTAAAAWDTSCACRCVKLCTTSCSRTQHKIVQQTLLLLLRHHAAHVYVTDSSVSVPRLAPFLLQRPGGDGQGQQPAGGAVYGPRWRTMGPM